MNKFILTLSSVLFIYSNASAQLSGKIRSNFLESLNSTCYDSQRANSANKGVDNKSLIKYCKCYGIYLADSSNNDLIISIERGEQKFNPNLMQLASDFCTKNYNKY